MLFSIITVTYNAQATLPLTVASVAEQSHTDYEHLVIDGNSTDATIEIIRQSVEANRRMRYISERDCGLYDAMNKGIRMAKGQYLIFLNAGDSFHSPTTLSEIADIISNNGTPDIVYGQTQLVDINRVRVADRHLRAPESLSFKSFAEGMVVCHQAFIARAKIAPEYDLRYRFSADYEWCIRCLKRSKSNVYVPGIIIDYLSEGMTTSNHKRSLRERYDIMTRYYGFIPTLWRHLTFIPRYLRHKKALKQSAQ